MQAYRNLASDSPIRAYEILDEAIRVQFDGGETYVYDYQTPGRDDVEKMKRLARAGRGLSTYIARFVRGRYALKQP